MSISDATLVEDALLAKVDRLAQRFADYFRFNRDFFALRSAVVAIMDALASSPDKSSYTLGAVSSLCKIRDGAVYARSVVDPDRLRGIVANFELRTLAHIPSAFDALVVYFDAASLENARVCAPSGVSTTAGGEDAETTT